MVRIDDYPTHEKDGLKYRCGRVKPFGASIIDGNAINYSIFPKDAVSCELLLFHNGEPEPFAVLPFPEEFRIGNVFSMIVYGLDYEDLEYGYCAVNAHWEQHTMKLPVIPAGMHWQIIAYTGDTSLDGTAVSDQVTLMPRSLMLLTGNA